MISELTYIILIHPNLHKNTKYLISLFFKDKDKFVILYFTSLKKNQNTLIVIRSLTNLNKFSHKFTLTYPTSKRLTFFLLSYQILIPPLPKFLQFSFSIQTQPKVWYFFSLNLFLTIKKIKINGVFGLL